MDYSAWGVSWLGTWGNSWGPLHEVEEVHRPRTNPYLKLKRIVDGNATITAVRGSSVVASLTATGGELTEAGQAYLRSVVGSSLLASITATGEIHITGEATLAPLARSRHRIGRISAYGGGARGVTSVRGGGRINGVVAYGGARCSLRAFAGAGGTMYLEPTAVRNLADEEVVLLLRRIRRA